MSGERKEIMNGKELDRTITRIAHEIIERNCGTANLAIVGVRTRGEFIGQRIVSKIAELEGTTVPFGIVDITLYRDDISQISEQPIVRGTDLPFNVDKYKIIIVDDVLFTCRTIRAAIDAIIDFGRPKNVQLAVICDRGHKELPIRADYVGKNIPTSRDEIVHVCLQEKDGEEGIYVSQRPKKN
jgi:pyrimidine operon attenuation protein/uracil phosphoribosyltransferase